MRRALVLAAVTALAVARPETYREKEDFQYSRSSSDDGTKSGFYGAQRGNMGGNYERSHNMDLLAQHQMGGLVRNVEGELGDGAKQKSGSVFTAANSRGIYGSGHYDLSHLEGRNFQEGTTFGDSQSESQSSLSAYNSNSEFGRQSQAYSANGGYGGSHSQNSRYNNGYHQSSNSDQALYASNTQSADSLQSASQYDGAHAGHNTGYYSQSGYQGQSAYDQAAASSHLNNGYGSNLRLVTGSPVRVYVRPGSRVVIPLSAQTYDTSHGSAATFDQNAVNSEAEVLGTNTQQGVYKPGNNAKHYESSYSYHKQWEKHDTIPVSGMPDTVPIAGVPVAVPTANPFPTNSELYEDTKTQGSEHQHEASGHEAQNVHSNSQYRGYNVKSGSSSQSRHQAYNANEHSAAANTAALSQLVDSNAYTHEAHNHGASANLNSVNFNNQVESIGSKPKSYQSSYSYHKSWERQGDPYVIKPATNGVYTNADAQASQRLTTESAGSVKQGASGYRSTQYGAHYQSQQGYSNINNADCDCDENGHIRVARSYNLGRNGQPSYQQSQNFYEGQENLGQQSQNLEDFGQQSQNLEDLGQQTQKLENLGQQSQNLEDFGQQSQNLEDLGQQSQKLEYLGQQSQNLEDLGQQTQNLADFGQQSQNLEDFGQQSQNLEDLGQKSQNLEHLHRQVQSLEDFRREPQFETTGSLSHYLEDFGQQSQNLEDLSQQTQNQWDQQSQTDLGQQTQNTWNTLETTQHGKDTEQQRNEKDHTGYDYHHTSTGQTEFRPQENVFEINHPSEINSLYQPESHTSHEGKPNPFEHVSFHEVHRNEEHTDQHEFTQNVAQDTSNFWNNFPPNMNQNNQNLFAPLPFDSNKNRQEQPDWQQILNAHNINTGYGEHQHNLNENAGYNPSMFNQVYSNNQHFPNNDFEHHEYASSVSSYDTNIQTNYNRNDYSTHTTSNNIHSNPHQSGSTSITDLWSLIDDIEQETTSVNRTSNFDSSNFFKENKENATITNSGLHTNENSFIPEIKPTQPVAFTSTEENKKAETTTINHSNFPAPDMERGDIGPEKKLRPDEDVGRGDIGPEDSSSEESYTPNKPLEIIESKPVSSYSKPYKTPKDIETLSLTKENDKTTPDNTQNVHEVNKLNIENDNKRLESELSVLSLNEQIHHSEQEKLKLQNDMDRTVSTTPKSNNHYVQPNFYVEEGPKDFMQENTDQQSENLGQEVEKLIPQTNNQFGGYDQQNVNLDQQNMDDQMVDFGQQSEKIGQENMEQQFESFNHQLGNLGHSFNLEHGPDEVQQQSMDQQFETLGQQSENLGQQTFNQFEDLNQQNENLGQVQQLETFGQQSESGFNQENIQKLAQHEGIQQESLSEFDHQNENLHSPQIDQQLGNWGQQNENLDQNVNLWKPNENLQQHSQQVETFVPPSPHQKEEIVSHDSKPVAEAEIIAQKTNNVDAPPEPVTEKVGFWNKIGSKFTTAKEKVSSWFSRS